MTIININLSRARSLQLLGLVVLASCKDETPCDPGQYAVNAGCYPITAGSGGTGAGPGTDGDGGMDGGNATDGGGGTDEAAATSGHVVGQPCADTAASSDCGGDAPICAPLPSGAVCTQILCLDGEPNAGACPTGWTCRAIGTNPSVCLNF